MNIVIYSNKKVKKYLEANLKNTNITVLGYETEIRSDFVKRITEDYNPHILVVFEDVKMQKGFNLNENLEKLNKINPNLKVILLNGFTANKRDFNDFMDLLENPVSQQKTFKVSKEEPEQAVISETKPQAVPKFIDKTPVTFSKKENESEFDIDTKESVDEMQEHLINTNNVSIAVSCVTFNSGVAQTAFEIAIMLSQSKNSVALFLSNERYSRYLKFHGIEKADNGFTANGLPIFPQNETEQAVKYKFAVYELTDTNNSSEQLKIFENADVKVSLCTGTEWDISYLEEYLNQALPYIKEINYCFYPVSQPDFMKYNKQMLKGHCKAYRLRTSPNYTNPCQWNRDVYSDILNRYLSIDTNKKFGLFRLR